MSKIQSIQSNYKQNYVDFNKNRTNFAKKQSFTGGGLEDLAEGAKKILLDGSAPQAKGMRKHINSFSTMLQKNKGEVEGQLINAFFTTTFAPIFIAFNPFTRQDEKTKKYTALRQPISAAVALGCSLPITKAVNDYVRDRACEGCIPTHDLRIEPDDKFLAEQFKKAKKAGSTTLSKEQYIKKIKEDRKELFGALLSADPEKIQIDEATKTISLLDDKNVAVKKWVDVPNLVTKTQLDAYKEKNNIYNVKLSKFMTDEFNFEFYEDGKFEPFSVDAKLKQVKAADFLERIGLIEKGKVNIEELNRVLSRCYQNEKTVNVAEKELAFKRNREGAKALIEAIAKNDNRNLQRVVGEDLTSAKNLTLGQLFQQIGLKDENGVNVKKFQELMQMKISEVLTKFSKGHLKDYKTGEKADGKEITLGAKKLLDFGKNLVKNKIGKASNHFGTYKGYLGIVVNLPVTILSCTILNWLYPRIVERLFPSLVKDDVKKGGNK